MVAQAVGVRPELSVVESTGSGKGKLHFTLHSGQTRAWDAEERFILVLAGLQSGKTVTGPLWLFREMRRKGPGDYLVGSPTFTLLELKALPEFKRLFVQHLRVGEYKASPVREFTLNRRGELMLWGAPQDVPTRVLFGHAQDPESLESGTYKGAWLDEAGQKKFRRDSWVSIQGRLSIYQGRVLFTTTPYGLGWLKSELYDRWEASGRNHPEIAVINFESIDNPAFPIEEFERARRTLPSWLFNMRYRGRFERPAGLIYGSFDPKRHVIPAFAIPDEWPRFLGLDFGGVNTAGVFLARELNTERRPTGRYIAYREYHQGGKTARGHAANLTEGEPRRPTTYGGSKSEGQWRDEFAAGGLSVAEPDIADVEIGILRIYGAFALDELLIFDSCVGLIEEANTYSREVDANGEPTELIEDKHQFHFLDALRYVGSSIWKGMATAPTVAPRTRVVKDAGWHNAMNSGGETRFGRRRQRYVDAVMEAEDQ